MRKTKLQENALNLRKNQTESETLLWSKLRSRQLAGFKFRRQHPIGHCILDFYCTNAHLAIEIDGGQHSENKNCLKDEFRTEYLKGNGIQVIKFWKNDGLENLEDVVSEIEATLIDILAENNEDLTPPSPLARKRAS